ncbi:GDSL-type esterase/lipase family protein [Alienimonas sp. DA493]|uniref:GDSL-type esterase/lipase family protein n=1 Tax=Alienimonas sp. DA493 TaxID=3373605 RepID=UPI0037553F9C
MTVAPLALLLCSLLPADAPADAPEVSFERWQSNIDRFQTAVEKLGERDRTLYEAGGPPEGAVLLAGSSSVRLWMEGDVEEDMAPIPVVARGYGGARFSDFAYYADRLFAPHLTPGEPGANVAAIALFVANDITGGAEAEPGDQTPEGAAKYVRHIIATAQAMDADVPIVLIAVTPTSSRWKAWPRINAFNEKMKEIAAADDNVYYLDTTAAYLKEDGTPNDALFRGDRLHLNDAGYAVWAEQIKAGLKPVLNAEK